MCSWTETKNSIHSNSIQEDRSVSLACDLARDSLPRTNQRCDFLSLPTCGHQACISTCISTNLKPSQSLLYVASTPCLGSELGSLRGPVRHGQKRLTWLAFGGYACRQMVYCVVRFSDMQGSGFRFSIISVGRPLFYAKQEPRPLVHAPHRTLHQVN